MSPYATSVIVAPRKSKTGPPFAETKKIGIRLLSIKQTDP